MKRRKARWARLGALAIMLVVPVCVVSASAAQASTVRLTSATNSGTPEILESSATSCLVSQSSCKLATGWVTFPDSCQVSTQVTFSRASNTVDVAQEVNSPFQFGSCTVYAAVWYGFASGPPTSSESFYGFACGAWDPTCGDPQTWSYYNASTGISAATAQSVISIEVTNTTYT
jgi:hypothetical protein